jgi:alkanesulfonate monooxygenase SsuD/methylene tetrahydromethanopterin reductase-like flavin-dependent oxidoreductase (luciferase family)
VSNDRFALGLGIGAGFVVERWFGVPFERPLRRMREFVAVVRGALESRNGEAFSFDGDVFHVRKYRMPLPPGATVPLFMAAVGPRMLELAGEIADGVMLGGIHSPAYLEEVRERITIGAERVGRDVSEFQIHAFVICATSEDSLSARGLARASIAYSAQYGHYRSRLEQEGFAGLADRIAEHVRRHEQTEALALVSDEMVDRFAIAGTEEECREQAARMEGTVDEIVLTLVPFRISEREAADGVLSAARALCVVADGSGTLSER